jgi:hypothetical protein
MKLTTVTLEDNITNSVGVLLSLAVHSTSLVAITVSTWNIPLKLVLNSSNKTTGASANIQYCKSFRLTRQTLKVNLVSC